MFFQKIHIGILEVKLKGLIYILRYHKRKIVLEKYNVIINIDKVKPDYNIQVVDRG